MVNIAGRSRGCTNCRRRRVKCDETRPICFRCQKSNLACDGARDMAFVDEGLKAQRKVTARVQMKSKDDAVTTSTKELAITPSKSISLKPYFSTSASTSASTSTSTSPIFPLAPTQSVDLSGWETEICISYARINMMCCGLTNRVWNSLLLHNLKPNMDDRKLPIMHQTYLAMAVTLFGNQHGLHPTLRKGLGIYGRALQKLYRSLQNLSSSTPVEKYSIVYAAVSLSSVEFFASLSGRTWATHISGAEVILQLTGPTAYCLQPARDMLMCVRPLLIIGAIITPRPTILAEPEWRIIPWALEPESKQPIEQLWDVLAQWVQLQLDRDKVMLEKAYTSTHHKQSDGMEVDISLPQRMVLRSKSLLSELVEWRQRWECANPSGWSTPLYEPSILPIPSNEVDSTVPILNAPDTIMLYNSAKILLLDIVETLERRCPHLCGDNTHADRVSTLETIKLAATEIHHCLDFSLTYPAPQNLSGTAGYMLMVLRICWSILSGRDVTGAQLMKDTLNGKASHTSTHALWTELCTSPDFLKNRS